ncbi:UNVERIFIED_CONTAM: hypothetical protein FKN15_010917 [Acipenser sinensis]
MMCEVMPTIYEDTLMSQSGSQSSGSESDTHFEQLLVNMLHERDRLLDTLRETQESLGLSQQSLEDVLYDRDSLQRQLNSALPQVRHGVLDSFSYRESGQLRLGHYAAPHSICDVYNKYWVLIGLDRYRPELTAMMLQPLNISQQVVEPAKSLKTISMSSEEARFLFYKRDSNTSAFESFLFPGWFISNDRNKEHMRVAMCNGRKDPRRVTEFYLSRISSAGSLQNQFVLGSSFLGPVKSFDLTGCRLWCNFSPVSDNPLSEKRT